MKEKIRIGCGAGFSGDRFDPSVILCKEGKLDYLVLECLAERTIGLAQKRKLLDPTRGYDPLLERRIKSLLPIISKNKIRLITNMGAANPLEAAKKIIEISSKLQINIKVVAVTGDDVFNQLDTSMAALETGRPLSESGELISANAYLGVEGILAALNADADIIITGRVADPSLFLAPMIYEFGWSTDNFYLLGQGTVIGHLLECAGQVTGGYFADPIRKPVGNLENLGHPFADVFRDGRAIISKVEGTGGQVNLQTVKEQLLYEVVNPYEYITPDVMADFTTVQIAEIGKDEVEVKGGSGKMRPSTFKVSVGYKAFVMGEGEISYAGAGALERAMLAGDIIRRRFELGYVEPAHPIADLRFDYIGLNSVHRAIFFNRTDLGHPSNSASPEKSVKGTISVPETKASLGTTFVSTDIPYEIRLRVVGKAQTPDDAALIGEEVEALYTNGPAAGGGVRKSVNEVIGIISTLIPRTTIESVITAFQY